VFQRILQSIICFCIVFAAYGVYAVAVAPLIEPPAPQRRPISSNGPGTRHMDKQRAEFARLFKPDSWELAGKSRKVLETSHGKLLFKDYKTLDGGRLHVQPFTLIFYANNGDDAEGAVSDKPPRPIVMQAPAGAILNFSKEIDLARADVGKLTGGRLIGEIHVSSPETAPGAGDRFDLHTRNVQLSQERIWTVHDVAFQFGHSYGRGRDLSITLTPPEKPGSEKKSTVERMKMMELIHVEKLYLHPGDKNLLSQDKASDAAKPADGSLFDSESPLEITCSGPMRYDFPGMVITLENEVAVHRHIADGPSESLLCEFLKIEMEKAPAVDSTTTRRLPADSATSAGVGAAAAGVGETAPADDAEPKMVTKLRRLIALGHPVQVAVPSQQVTAKGARLEYDFHTSRILLLDPHGVELKHTKGIVRSRRVEYELAEDANRLGRIWASGPGNFAGELEVRDKQPDGSRVKQPKKTTASWAGNLQIIRDGEFHVLSLRRNAELQMQGMGGFSAEEIHVWLREVAVKQPVGVTADKKKQRFEMIPDRLMALGGVSIRSPRLNGSTDRLEAWIRDEEVIRLPAPHGVAAAEGVAGGALLTGYPARGGNPDVRGHGAAGGAVGGIAAKPASQPSAFHVTGQLVRAQLMRRGDETTLENITIDGNVHLRELHTVKPGANKPAEKPLVITGDTLTVQQLDSPSESLTVIGSEATVAARGMDIHAGNVQLQRGQNRMWIDGPGQMTLPARRPQAAAAAPVSRMPNSLSATRITEPVTVDWRTGMNFNGRMITFSGDVRASTTTRNIATSTLEVTLDRLVDFSNTDNAGDADARTLMFRGGVTMRSRNVEEGRLTSIENMQVKQLFLDQQTGEVHADGPGWLTSVRAGASKPLSTSAAQVVARPANSSLAPRDKLNYMYVDFQREMNGNMERKDMEILGDVKAVYGPVKTWESKLRADVPGGLGPRGAHLRCDRLALAEMGPQISPDRKAVEIEATGNAVIESETYTARAKRISFAEAKQLIILEGDGRVEAELWRQARTGAARSHTAARKILYWHNEDPRLTRVEVNDASVLDLSGFGVQLDSK